MGALAGVMGSMMAMEAVREIVGFGDGLVGRLLMIDALSMRFETLRYKRDPQNPLNGDKPCHHRCGRASLDWINQESLIYGDAQSGDEPVCLRSHADDCNHLGILLIGHALRASARCVRMNAVTTTMSNRNCHVEHFLDLGLEGAGRHHLFDALPGPAKCFRIVSQRAPKVVDEIRLARLANVIEDYPRFMRELIVR
jgi:hypothetical protein